MPPETLPLSNSATPKTNLKEPSFCREDLHTTSSQYCYITRRPWRRKNDLRHVILLQSFRTEGGPSAVKNQAGKRMMTEQNQNLEWSGTTQLARRPSGRERDVEISAP